VEFVSRILGLVLEGNRVTSAMLVQDYSDRQGERWLSLPEELSRRPEQPQLAHNLLKKQGSSGNALTFEKGSGDSLVPIDWRKGLARGSYLPGQVAYQGLVYERRDMLALHHKLLDKAHAAFVKGPQEDASNSAAPPPNISAQPGANGGKPGSAGFAHNLDLSVRGHEASREHLLLASGEDKSREDAKLSSSMRKGPPSPTGATRLMQRPGSQGQPQAKGSRGTMWGPLGETEPPVEGDEAAQPPPSVQVPRHVKPAAPSSRAMQAGGVESRGDSSLASSMAASGRDVLAIGGGAHFSGQLPSSLRMSSGGDTLAGPSLAVGQGSGSSPLRLPAIARGPGGAGANVSPLRTKQPFTAR